MMHHLHQFLLQFKLYRQLIEWTRKIKFPLLGNVPLYTVISFFFREISKGSLTSKASSLSYNFMLATFPAIIFFFTLIPYLPIKNIQFRLLNFIELVMPHGAFIQVREVLLKIINSQQHKLFSFGFIMALVLATNGIHNLMENFNKSSLIIETRSWLKQRLIALGLTLLSGFTLTLGLIIIALDEYFLNYLQTKMSLQSPFWIHIILYTRWLIVIMIYFSTISTIYKYGPANREKWHFFSGGAFMATISIVLTSLGFSYYVNHFSTYDYLYGSLGALMVVMIWIYLNSLVLLLGFEFNASIDISKRNVHLHHHPIGKQKNEGPPTELPLEN